MSRLHRPVIGILLLLLVLPLKAQVSQELIDKAKAAGFSEQQIQQEINKRIPQTNPNNIQSTTNLPINDRTVIAGRDSLPSIEAQRMMNLPDKDLSETIFGHEIFTKKELSFEPDLNIPTPKGYVLSAGDELSIQVYGDSELNLKLRISPEGTILIPNLGPVAVSGLTVAGAEDKLRRELGRIMISLSDESTNTFVSISLSQIRSIKVNIVGEVVAPGTYTLPSFATLFNALYAAGGVNEIGTLRSIRVFRNSKEVANMDVYDFLLHGKYNDNIRLEENDVIMVGPYDQLAVARGKVKRNRIFELKKGETLQQLLEMTGGFTGDAYTKDVRIKRKADSRYRIATVTQDQFKSFIIQDGDSLLVDSVIPHYENRLQVFGAVWRPGEYELTSKVRTTRQLVEQAAGLKGDEFTGRAQIYRLNPDFTYTVIAIDIIGILNGTVKDVELQPEDYLYIPSLFELQEPYTIKVSGAVNIPDTIMPYKKNMTVEDAIMIAGGLRESASTIHVEVARRIKDPQSSESQSQRAKVFDLTLRPDFQVDHGENLFILEPFDEVNVRFSPGYREQQSVKVKGEITFAGDYVLAEKNARLSTIVALAGNVTPDAYVRGASLKRKLSEDELRRLETIMDLSANKESRDSVAVSLADISVYSVGIDLEKALANPGGFHDVVLKDGDELYIPEQQSTVKVSGAVTYPNSVTYTRGMNVKECLSQAGGYNDLARKYPIVVYMNGKVATTKKTMIFFKRYPKVEPGCEILVPNKTFRENRMGLPEILSIGSSTTSMAAMIMSMVNTIDSMNNRNK